MKARTKIVVVLLICAGAFLAFNITYYIVEARTLNKLFVEESRERTASFRNILTMAEGPLETYAYDYTLWDEMAAFTVNQDKDWAENNIEVSLQTYKACAAWVYKKDLSLVYSAFSGYDSPSKGLPLPEGAIPGLFGRSRFCHFFIRTPAGPLEIRGATIHSTIDKDRKEMPFGYFFVARIWNKAYIDRLSKVSAAGITLHYSDERIAEAVSDMKKGAVVFYETLYGWDGKPMATVGIVSQSPAIKIYFNSMKQMIMMFLAYSVAVFLVLFFALVVWIWNPLNLIASALAKNSTTPIRGLVGRPDEFGDIAGLVTRFFEQRQALIETEKMSAMGRFASGAAHEIKNPLAIIYSSVEYLQAKFRGADAITERAITNSIQAISRADAIINALVKFSDTQKLRIERISIDALVKDGLGAFMLKVKTPNVRIAFESGGEKMMVDVDQQQLEHALFNILLNAIEAMPAGGVITVRIRREARCVIEVADTGEGISAEDMLKVFEPFFTTRRDNKQVGIGLTMAKVLINANKGDIKITSEKGKGAIIRIALPIAS